MGQHTWFHKSRTVYEEIEKYFSILEQHHNGSKPLTDEEFDNVEYEIDRLYYLNEADYHDCFRTSKRYPDGSYIDEVIYSKDECYKWLEDNKEHVQNLDSEYLNKFWEEFPDGVIDFG